jgi:hypothetical protein
MHARPSSASHAPSALFPHLSRVLDRFGVSLGRVWGGVLTLEAVGVDLCGAGGRRRGWTGPAQAQADLERERDVAERERRRRAVSPFPPPADDVAGRAASPPPARRSAGASLDLSAGRPRCAAAAAAAAAAARLPLTGTCRADLVPTGRATY